MAVVAAPSTTALSPQVGAQIVSLSGGNKILPVFQVRPVDAAPHIYPAPTNRTYGYAS